MKVSMLIPQPLELQTTLTDNKLTKTDNSPSFAEILRNKFEQVNQLQKESDNLTQNLLVGDVEHLHQVTVAAEQAALALQLTVQIRNKLVEAYQEISRMQI